MMRKLLYSFLFFISNSSKKTFKPSFGLLCVGMFFVFANSVSGQITQPIAWTKAYDQTVLAGTGFNFSITTGSNRVLVVAISTTFTRFGGDGTQADPSTITYGGVALTKATGNGSTSGRAHTWLYYLKDNAIMDGTSRALNVTGGSVNSGTLANMTVWYSVFENVNQAPANYTVGNGFDNNSPNGATARLSAAMTINMDEQAVYVSNLYNENSTTIPSYTINGNWTSGGGDNGSGGGFWPYAWRNEVAKRVIPTANVTDQAATSSINPNGDVRYAMSAMSLPRALPTITSLGSTNGCVGGTITINGTNLTGATAANVRIGGTAVTSISSISATQIVAVIGNGTTGTVTVNNGIGTATSAATFTVNPLPTTSNAGPDQYGNTAFTLAANSPSVGTGVWTIASGPNMSLSQFSNASSRTATFTPLTAGTYALNWTISNSCGTSTDQVIVSNCVGNLIKNGDFSFGNTDWSPATTYGNLVEINTEGTYFSATGSNDNTAELDSQASLMQTVTVVPNIPYTLSFLYAKRVNAPPTVAVNVKITGASYAASTNYYATSEGTPNNVSYTFTPTSSSITIELYNNQNSGATFGSIIDNIVLVPSSQITPVAVTSPKGTFKTLTACAGVPIQLDVENVSVSGATYVWSSTSPGAVFSSTTIKNPTVTFTGTGSRDATVVVTTPSGCSGAPSTTYVNLLAAPTVYNVTGGSSCSSGAGITVGLSGSTSGVSYQLQLNGVNVGTAVAGSGSAITFGSRTAVGTYTVVATNPSPNNCALNMNGSAVIYQAATLSLTTGTASQTVCAGTAITNIVYTFGGGATGVDVTNLPAGLTSNVSGSTVTISGTPTAGGTFSVATTGQTSPCNPISLGGTITVNPVHTITAGTNQSVCQNNAMTNITMTLGGGATGATVTGLPSGVTYAVSGTTTVTLTISGTPTVSGQFTYNVTTTGNSCTVATTSGTITVGIGNNTITYTNGTSGYVCINAQEHNSDPANFIAPNGTYFNTVSFASYGTAFGSCPSFSINTICHASGSQSIVESRLLGNSGTIGILPSNSVFQDPCVNVVKTLKVIAYYSQAICYGTAPGTIIGSDPTGSGTYDYEWQSSATATGTFTPIASSNTKDYAPGVLTASTYFRRVVTSGGCTSTSPVILIKVNPLPTIATAATTSAVCYGTTNATLAYTGTTETPTTYSITWNASPANTFATVTDASLTTSPISITIPSTAAANTYTGTITVKNANGCVSTGNSFTLTVRPQFTAGAIQTTGQTICLGQNPTQIGNTTFASGGNGTITYKWQANGVDIASSNSATYTPPAGLAITTTYTRLANDGACNTTPTASTGSWTVTVRQIENAPTPGTITNVTCLNQGTVVLSNLPSGSWQINQTGPGAATSSFTGSGTPYTVTGLAAGNYYFAVQTATTCASAQTSVVNITDQSSTTWNGSSWSHGTPDSSKSVIIASTAGNPFATDIEACSLTISVPNATTDPVVTVPEGITLTITNAVTSNGKLVFENNASLVQTTNAVNTGEIVYKRKALLARYDASYWSMPVTKANFKMSDFSPNTLADKYLIFNSNASVWEEVPNGNLPMVIGQGYSIRAPQSHSITNKDEFIGVFTGIPNNGDLTLPVDNGKWYLIGNPYPSAINAVQFLADNSGMGTLYFWQHNNLPVLFPDGKYYYMDDFLAVNSLGSNGTFSGHIAAAQGFMVKSGGTAINFRNIRRVKGNNSQFFKTAASDEIERHRLWVNLKNDTGVSKQILLGYATGATNTTDADFDAITMSSTTEFYSINNNKKLTIQGRALPFENSDSVPLGVKLAAEGNYTITIDHADGLFNDGQDVFLEDKTTGTITNLRTSDYTFKSAAGSFNSRFVITYTNKTLGNDDFENLENGVLVSVKDKVVKITSSKESIKNVTIFNIGAQLIYNKNNVNSSELQISNLNSSDQALLVKITLENGHTFTKKIIYSNL